MLIVDSHVHIADLSSVPISWMTSTPQFNRNFLRDDLRDAIAPDELESYIFVEVDADASLVETKYIHQYAKLHDPKLKGMVVSLPVLPQGDTLELQEYITTFKQLDEGLEFPLIKGIRYLLQSDDQLDDLCIQPKFRRACKILGDNGLSFDICVSFKKHPKRLTCVYELAKGCPGTTFILDHSGKPDVDNNSRFEEWASAIESLGALENVFCKISGLVTETDDNLPFSVFSEKESLIPSLNTVDRISPYVLHIIKSFGKEKIMFGGDWPVCLLKTTYTEWVHLLKEIVKNVFSENESRAFWNGNAKKIYRI
ncbi:hypothetical protein HK096_006589 [Nowakowskiella sp. JEL0078]|nr:hypothetical protein HK096_006589 [Nowakowskiella sp. JEL0078]